MIRVEARDLRDPWRHADHVLKRDCLIVGNQIPLETKVDDTVRRLTVIERADRDRDGNVLHADVPVDDVAYRPTALHVGLDTDAAGRMVQCKSVDENAVLVACLGTHRHAMAAVEVIVEHTHVLNIRLDGNVVVAVIDPTLADRDVL